MVTHHSFSRLWSRSETTDKCNYILNRTGSIIIVVLVSHISFDQADRLDICLRPTTSVDAQYRRQAKRANNSPSLSKYGSMCQGFVRRFLCPIFRDPLRGERIAIQPPSDSVPNRSIQAGQKRQFARRRP